MHKFFKSSKFPEIGLSLILLGFLSVSTVYAESSPFNEAMELDRQGFLEESIGSWKKFIQTQPEKDLQIFAQIKMGIALYKTGQFLKARDSASELSRTYPEHFAVNFHLGNVMANLGQFPEARQAYEKVVQSLSNEGLGYVGLGLTYFGEQKPDLAVQTLRKVRSIFKKQKNVAWYQNVRIMIGQIKGFSAYPPNFSQLWLTNNLKVVRDTFESSVLRAFEEELVP
jgi:tetratricopeptide (TPR) repeat protein